MNERLLQLFRENPDRYLSGEQISRQLGVSRTAIWKHIQELKQAGFEIEAVPRLGYRLLHSSPLLVADDIRARLATRRFGRRLHLLGETDSTQRVALELARNGAEEGTLVIAERQTAGRGRMGRSWHSPAGKGIYMSLILKPDLPLHQAPQLTLLTSVAVVRAIRMLVPKVDVQIKWPNDLLVRGRKLCGILLESSAENERLQHVVAGIGISVNLSEEDYPEELRSIATSLRMESGETVNRAELIAQCMAQLEQWYEVYLQQGFPPIRTLWEAYAETIGRKVSIRSGGRTVTGLAIGLDDYGGLIVDTGDGGNQTIYTWDNDSG